jgi:hypothetical protein
MTRLGLGPEHSSYRAALSPPYLVRISGWMVDTALRPCSNRASASFMFDIGPPVAGVVSWLA